VPKIRNSAKFHCFNLIQIRFYVGVLGLLDLFPSKYYTQFKNFFLNKIQNFKELKHEHCIWYNGSIFSSKILEIFLNLHHTCIIFLLRSESKTHIFVKSIVSSLRTESIITTNNKSSIIIYESPYLTTYNCVNWLVIHLCIILL